MKHILYLLFFIFFFVEINNETFALNINADTTTQNKLILTNDSGFVSLKEGLDFLLYNSLIDTSDCVKFWLLDNPDTIQNVSFWDLCNPTDTIAKYYRKGNSNTYIMCVFGRRPTYPFSYYIIEINSDGELIKRESFIFSCYKDTYEVFYRYGDFFGIKTCYVMVGAFRSDLFLFKEITPQDSINPISFLRWWHSGRIFLKRHASNIEVKKDELIINYLIKFDITKKQPFDKNGDWRYKTPRTKNLSKKYLFENGQWISKDTEKDKKLEKKIDKWANKIITNTRQQ